MAQTNPPLAINGEHCTFVFLVGQQPVAQSKLLIKTGTFKQDAQIFKDKYAGRSRDRMDKKVNGFTSDFVADYADNSIITALRDIDVARENNQPLDSLSVQIIIARRNGTFEGWALLRAVATYEFDSKDASTRSEQKFSFTYEDLQPVAL